MRLMITLSSMMLIAAAATLSACQQQQTAIAPESPHVITAEQTAGQHEKKTDKFLITIDVTNPPLETQEETYMVKVEDLYGQAAEAATFEVTMPMEGMEPMVAPTTAEKLSKPGTYQLKSTFTMPGEWLVEVKPTTSADVVSVPVQVQ